MKKVKFLIGLVVCMATIVYPAFAYDYDLYDNFVGDSLAVAEEDVGVSSSTSWYATIHSWITPELYIDAIGWSRWTFQEICGGTVVDNWPQSGYTVFGGSLQDWGYDSKDDCSYTHTKGVYSGGTISGREKGFGNLTWIRQRAYNPDATTEQAS